MRLNREGCDSQVQAGGEGIGTSSNLQKRSSRIVPGSDSSDGPKNEVRTFDERRMSIVTPSRLVEIAQSLKEWMSVKSDRKILEVQKRLLDPKYRSLVAGTPFALIMLFILHTTSGIPRCLIFLLAWWVWNCPSSKS